jgi:hypothetical protein
MASINDFKLPPLRQEPEFVGTGMVGQLVGMCTCGCPKPLILMLHPGVPFRSKCEMCETVYEVVKNSFDQREPQKMDVVVGKAVPKIVKPGV